MVLTLASVGLPTTSGFTGEFLVLLGAFKAAWPLYRLGYGLPLVLAVGRGHRRRARRAVHAALRARLPVRRGQGAAPAAARPRPAREERSSALIVVAVFALGLFPDEPMRKTELAGQGLPATASARRACRRARHEQPRRADRDAARAPAAARHRAACSASRSRAARSAPRSASPSLARRRGRGGRGRPVARRLRGSAVRRAVLGRPGQRCSPRPWCWRWRCRCC